jgi:hypothetical protein
MRIKIETGFDYIKSSFFGARHQKGQIQRKHDVDAADPTSMVS